MNEETSFTVTDMTCNHCASTVRQALETALPKAQINIDLETHTVRFTGDRTVGEKAIREAGYTPEMA